MNSCRNGFRDVSLNQNSLFFMNLWENSRILTLFNDRNHIMISYHNIIISVENCEKYHEKYSDLMDFVSEFIMLYCELWYEQHTCNPACCLLCRILPLHHSHLSHCQHVCLAELLCQHLPVLPPWSHLIKCPGTPGYHWLPERQLESRINLSAESRHCSLRLNNLSSDQWLQSWYMSESAPYL